jgi:hypothetical protein
VLYWQLSIQALVDLGEQSQSRLVVARVYLLAPTMVFCQEQLRLQAGQIRRWCSTMLRIN